jgi:endonuclease/exonuclease/phosphatase family metal-dependent hydrolase
MILKTTHSPRHVTRPFVLTIAIAFATAIGSAAESGATNNALCVMTYNLRYASSTPPNAWPQRRPIMREVIQQISPDIFGTQEGLYGQITDIAADAPEYTWVGVGRDDGATKGEFMAVFYRKSRLEPLSTNHFWLSDTPEVPGSTTWGNKNRRMVTWLKFRDQAANKEFYFWNTHFDHEVQSAREKSAELVRKRIESLNTSQPLLLVGDFNANAEQNKAYHTLVDDGFLADTWRLAKQRIGEGLNTFNGFKEIGKQGRRIDWLLARGKVEVDTEEIVTFSKDGQFPSDHFPVVARLRLSDPK